MKISNKTHCTHRVTPWKVFPGCRLLSAKGPLPHPPFPPSQCPLLHPSTRGHAQVDTESSRCCSGTTRSLWSESLYSIPQKQGSGTERPVVGACQGWVPDGTWSRVAQMPTLDLIYPEESYNFLHIDLHILFFRKITRPSGIFLIHAHHFYSCCVLSPQLKANGKTMGHHEMHECPTTSLNKWPEHHGIKQHKFVTAHTWAAQRRRSGCWWGWFCPGGLTSNLFALALHQGPPYSLAQGSSVYTVSPTIDSDPSAPLLQWLRVTQESSVNPGWYPHLWSFVMPTKAVHHARRCSHRIRKSGHPDLWGCHPCLQHSLFLWDFLCRPVFNSFWAVVLDLYVATSFTDNRAFCCELKPLSCLFCYLFCPVFWWIKDQ